MKFSQYVKEILLSKMHEMASCCWLFVRNPNSDFTRRRKLDFETMLRCLIAMESGSLKRELLKMFRFNPDTATVSAFNQQREKILPEALEFLFREFNQGIGEYRTYRGFRLLANDSSDLNIARNPDDWENYFQHHPDSAGYNQLQLNAMYDLLSRRYTDAIIHPGVKNNECRAMADMIDRCDCGHKTIFIADRGYEAYNIFAHAEQRGMYYLVRVKDVGSRGGMASSFPLPQTKEFDTEVNLMLTRKYINRTKACLGYKFLSASSPFDYLSQNKFYPISLRVVRFAIDADTYECVITNLSKKEFPPDELKKLYGMRWGIETAFRELKYAIGLSCFHAKKLDSIKQEIFARLILYNFCEIITAHVAILQKVTKHAYQANYTMAIHFCRHFLRFNSDISPPVLEMLIQQNLLPVRPGRTHPRKHTPKAFVSFMYRIA